MSEFGILGPCIDALGDGRRDPESRNLTGALERGFTEDIRVTHNLQRAGLWALDASVGRSLVPAWFVHACDAHTWHAPVYGEPDNGPNHRNEKALRFSVALAAFYASAELSGAIRDSERIALVTALEPLVVNVLLPACCPWYFGTDALSRAVLSVRDDTDFVEAAAAASALGGCRAVLQILIARVGYDALKEAV